MNPGENWAPAYGSTTARDIIRPWATGYRPRCSTAEVFNQGTEVGEEGAVQAKEFPTDQTLVSLAGTAGLSPNSTLILSN